MVKGEIKISLSEDTPIEKTQIRVSTTTNGESSDRIRPEISKSAPIKIRDTFSTFFTALENRNFFFLKIFFYVYYFQFNLLINLTNNK